MPLVYHKAMSFKEFCRVLELEGQAITHALSRFKADSKSSATIESTVNLIMDRTQKGGKVLVIGLGKSGKIASKIAATLASTGTPSLYIHPTEALHGDLGVVGPHDVVLAISYNGSTEEVLALVHFF